MQYPVLVICTLVAFLSFASTSLAEEASPIGLPHGVEWGLTSNSCNLADVAQSASFEFTPQGEARTMEDGSVNGGLLLYAPLHVSEGLLPIRFQGKFKPWPFVGVGFKFRAEGKEVDPGSFSDVGLRKAEVKMFLSNSVTSKSNRYSSGYLEMTLEVNPISIANTNSGSPCVIRYKGVVRPGPYTN